MTVPSFDSLEVFYGETSQAEARVYARLPIQFPTGYQLTGRVVGPECLYSKTLPASFRLMDRGPWRMGSQQTLLAEAVVPDPCFWSPELPFLYQVDVELRRGRDLVGSAQRVLGLRLLGARRKQLAWEGKNWVLRGVYRAEMPSEPWDEWRESSTAVVVPNPSDTQLAAASRKGLLMVADLCSVSNVQQELMRVRGWPAVAMAIVSSDWQPAEWNPSGGNLVLAERFGACDVMATGEEVHAVVVAADNLLQRREFVQKQPKPVIVERRLVSSVSLAESRRACDQLQADLAGIVDCAGFLV